MLPSVGGMLGDDADASTRGERGGGADAGVAWSCAGKWSPRGDGGPMTAETRFGTGAP